MVKIKLIPVKGSWQIGCALDYHTVKSFFLGHDPYGFPVFDTTYTEIGNLLNRL
jgi:hypothetical protein